MIETPIEPNSREAETLLAESLVLKQALEEMGQVVVGQSEMMRSLVMGILTGGHVLLEGLPGLAKTLAVKTLAQVIDAKFQRVQFTPDLLPSDLIGTVIYREQTGEFLPKKGPIFANIVLADEINRAPAKVQSALLEAMAEKQVTIGETTYRLEEPFLVLATMNPIEQEGTYTLPEAQLDRFMFKLRVRYPTRDEERLILKRMTQFEAPSAKKVISSAKILEMRHEVARLYLDERIEEYILRLVLATRKEVEMPAGEAKPEKLREIRAAIAVGASPRASIFLAKASRAFALLEGRTFVTPDDVKGVAYEILRHRLILTFEAEARNLSTDDVIHMLLDTVTVP